MMKNKFRIFFFALIILMAVFNVMQVGSKIVQHSDLMSSATLRAARRVATSMKLIKPPNPQLAFKSRSSEYQVELQPEPEGGVGREPHLPKSGVKSGTSKAETGGFSFDLPSVEGRNSQNSKFFKDLHQFQNPASCTGKNFLVYNMPKHNQRDTRNLGAMITSLWRWVIIAQEHEHIVIINSTNWNMAGCDNNLKEQGGFTCYFQPFSSCTIRDVDRAAPRSEHHQLTDIGDVLGLRKEIQQHTVVYATKTFSPLVGKVGCAKMIDVVAYAFRLQPKMRATIATNLQASLPRDFVPETAVGLPIRGSDKCKGHNLKDGSAGGEMECIPFSEYIVDAEKIRLSNPSVNTLVVTSEDPNVIQQAKDYGLTPKGQRWHLVFNTNDVMQGTGSSSVVLKSAVVKARQQSLSYFQVMSSVLTSLHLQLSPKFLITHSMSSFLLLIGLFHDHCPECSSSNATVTKWYQENKMCS